jgi:GDP-L-fucose synthase
MEKYDGPEQVNVGTGSDLEIREIAELVAHATGYQGKTTWDISKPDGTPRKLLDVSKIKSYGWLPKVSLEQGLVNAVAEFRSR